MPLLDLYRVVRDASRDNRNALKANRSNLAHRILDVFLRTWDLGFTAFGGPPVHFKIFHSRFVLGSGRRSPWIDEQTYQELFAICQALPGPGSTKMLFCIVLIHAGILPALFVFLTWSLPGATGMFALAVGVGRIKQQLPDPVYALLSGLNASTVGIIALAAVQLAEGAIRDRLSRILVIFGATLGLCYTALWYFPVIMIAGSLAAVAWDEFLSKPARKVLNKIRRKKVDSKALEENTAAVALQETAAESEVPVTPARGGGESNQRSSIGNGDRTSSVNNVQAERVGQGRTANVIEKTESHSTEGSLGHAIPLRIGLLIIVSFFLTFIALLVARGVVHPLARPLGVFSNMYLAGTIIFGGGPVVIPLLRAYVVQPGWVSNRDFLIGLAIIQAFPGPNFNFAVYLGALSLRGTQWPTILGALLGYTGIFIPGITLAVGFQSLWQILRSKAVIISALRGINATAVGLVFTAVYRLWEIGYLTKETAAGRSLGLDPFWVVVASLTYAESAWFRVPPAVSIVLGAILGLCWYGAVGRR